MSEATTQEELFRAFESQPGNYRLIHHPALRERPVRWLREVGESENIQLPERGYRS